MKEKLKPGDLVRWKADDTNINKKIFMKNRPGYLDIVTGVWRHDERCLYHRIAHQ
jgi:hypothetical protein